MSAAPLRACRVHVPGSTSNLGAGFDCLGLAVDRTLEVVFESGGGELEIRREGTLAEVAAAPGEDLLVRAFRDGLGSLGAPEPGGILHARSDIPVGKGLGSSAAALVAGRALAELATGRPVDAEAAFRAALAVEGHGDNAAPAAYGGLRAVVGEGTGVRALELALSERVGFAYAAPSAGLNTLQARRALPATVPFGTAAETVRRVTALIRGLAEGDADLLALGFADVLHAPHRMALIPGAADAAEAAAAAGAWGVTVSGAGSGLLAVGPPELAPTLARALAFGLRDARGSGASRSTSDAPEPGGVISFPLRPVRRGVRAIPTA